MENSLVNVFGVSVVAFTVPFVLGFFPRLRLPAIVAEIVAGILVGPAVLGWLEIDEPVRLLATLGVAFLLFLAGFELDLGVLRGSPLKLGTLGFGLSLLIALTGAVLLSAAGLVLTPLLVAVALSSTSVGIVVPVLKDTGNLDTDVGRFTVAGGAAAEFGSIALLGLLFAAPVRSGLEQALTTFIMSVLLAAFAALAAGLFWVVSRVVRWEAGLRVAERMDETSSQLRTRFVVMLVLAMAVFATGFGFEAILGTFLAGIFVGGLVRNDPKEELYRTRLEAIGFGFLVPVFFIASGMRLDVKSVFTADELVRVAIFLVLLLVARGLPALLYRDHIGMRGAVAAGLMQASNVSFVVVAVTVGVELEEMLPITASSLVVAGLLSALLFPAIAQSILARGGTTSSGLDASTRPQSAG